MADDNHDDAIGSGAGAAAALTTERNSSSKADGAEPEACPDCGAPLTGPHCARCGQSAHVPRSFAAWWRDTILHGVVHPEGRFWTTLSLLVVRPGELTRRYVAGERTKFVSPPGMFLFGFFVLFAAMIATGADKGLAGDASPTMSMARAELDLRETIDKAAEERPAPGEAAPGSGEAAQDVFAELEAWQEGRQARAENALFFIEQAQRAWAADGNPIPRENGLDRAGVNLVRQQLSDPALFATKLQSHAHRFSWLLIPLLIPFMWLLFVNGRRQLGFYHHASFVTYSLAFASLLATASVLLAAAGVGAAVAVSLFGLGVLVHGSVQMKGAYPIGWGGAVVRAVLLMAFAPIALALFISALA